MQNIDPREIIKHCFEILKLYPDESLILEIYTGIENGEYLSNFEIFYVTKHENNFEISFENNNGILILNNINQLLKLLKNYVITIIGLQNRLENSHNSFTLFRCENKECLNIRKSSANKIQSSFRKSREYAAWKYHPERLKKQGYFDENSDLPVKENKKIPLSNQQVKIYSGNYNFGKRKVKNLNKDNLYLSKLK